MGEILQDGSGWKLEKILKVNLVVMDYHPIRVGKYIPMPEIHQRKGGCY